MTRPARFGTTRWSVVLSAGEHDSADARAALETLCGAYWYPLYAFARREGADVHTAQDLTQGFLADFIERGSIDRADPERGRFRTYLLRCFRHFASKARAAERAEKRGGGRVLLSLDFEDGEQRFLREPAHVATPERVYARRYALTLLSTALDGLHAEFERAGKGDWFAALEPYLGAAGAAPPMAETAARLGSTEGAVKVAVHRLRKRYRDTLRATVADTVHDPAEVDDELRALMAALSDD